MKWISLLTLAASSVVMGQDLPDHLPATGLVAWYPLDGDVQDYSGNLNHATNYGATASTDRWGIENAAYQLDGIDDDIRLDLQSISNTFPAGSSFSINCWIKSDDLAGPITSFRGSVVMEFAIGTLADIRKSSGKIGGLIRDDATCCGAGNNFFSTASLSSDWHMVTFVRRGDLGGVMEIFLDGVSKGSSSSGQNEAITPIPSKMSIGSEQEWIQAGPGCGSCNSLDDRYLAATIDDYSLYNRALTTEEIAALYNAPPPQSGCTDETACNYNPDALIDDESCINFSALAEIDTIALFPDSLVLPLPDGYDEYQWSDDWGSTERPVLDSGSYTLNMVMSPAATQSQELSMVNLTPQTPYQGSWANAAVTNSESLRYSTTGAWSFSAWINLDEGDSDHFIIGKDLWWGNGYFVHVQGSQLKSAFYSNESGYVDRTAGTIANGVYEHILVTHDGTTRKHFVNGTEVGSWEEPSTFDFSDADVGIGYCASAFDCTFNGRMDELMVWHRAITPEEVADLMQCPAEVDSTGLIAFWDFEAADGGPSADKSGNGNFLTWVNSPTIEPDGRTLKCSPTCSSLTYNLTISQPSCHDDQACNYSVSGHSAPDSCSYLTFSNIQIQPATGAGGHGGLYVEVSGGVPPFTVGMDPTQSTFPAQSHYLLLPGRITISAADAEGCATREPRTILIPYSKCD